MSLPYYSGGTQWHCRRCDSTVQQTKRGSECRCETWPSPWEPVRVRRLDLVRTRGYRAGWGAVDLPFSREVRYYVRLFGWTLEWFRRRNTP
jgi:hypothetical protein